MDKPKNRSLYCSQNPREKQLLFREKDFYTSIQVQPEMKFVPSTHRPKVGKENPHIEKNVSLVSTNAT